MSVALAADLPSGSIDTSLAEVDTRSRDPKWSNGDIVVGPFSVMDMTPVSTAQPPPPPTASGPYTEETGETMQQLTPCADIPAIDPSFMMADLSQMDDFLHWSDLFDFSAMPSGLTPQCDSDTLDIPTLPMIPVQDTNMDRGEGPMLSTTIITPQHTPDTGSMADVMVEAPFLLKHFQDRVIAQMMAMPLGEKSPWKILNVPGAVLTFSDITFLGAQKISHARLANFYSIMACSAFHLSLNPDPTSTCSVDHWRQVAEQAHLQGKENMQLSLKYELYEPKKAKYKDQLMAICGMTEFAVCSD